MSETKQLHPAVDWALALRFDVEADERVDEPPSFVLAPLIRRFSSRGSIRALLIRNIWCSAYHPSRVAGGCAIGGVVMM
jgi:hypothetical protein